MNLSEAEANLNKLKEWFAKIKDNPIKCIFIILMATILWLVKLAHIDSFYKINQLVKQQFNIDLVNNGIFTASLFLASGFAVIVIVYNALKLIKGIFIKIVIIPYNYKHLSPDEKKLLWRVCSYNDELDCQHNREIARKLEKKHMLTLHKLPLGYVDDWPLYAKINQTYKKIINRLISKDNQI